jgi:hypothetical protein
VVQPERVRRGCAVYDWHEHSQPRSRAGYRNVDFARMRRVPLSASKALEVRAEVFNATNTPPFLAPNTQVGAAAFGTITSAGDPRVVQLGLKFIF